MAMCSDTLGGGTSLTSSRGGASDGDGLACVTSSGSSLPSESLGTGDFVRGALAVSRMASIVRAAAACGGAERTSPDDASGISGLESSMVALG